MVWINNRAMKISKTSNIINYVEAIRKYVMQAKIMEKSIRDFLNFNLQRHIYRSNGNGAIARSMQANLQKTLSEKRQAEGRG